jgi:hypothetical protein
MLSQKLKFLILFFFLLVFGNANSQNKSVLFYMYQPDKYWTEFRDGLSL